jgi:hypothetical protein
MKRSTVGLFGALIGLIGIAYLVTLKPGESSVDISEGDLLVAIDSALVDKIQITNAGDEVVLEKRSDQWFVTAPVDDAADAAAVGTALRQAADLRIKGIVSQKAEKHPIFQVDSMGTEVTLHQADQEPVTIIVGKSSSSFLETYVRQYGSDDVALINGSLSQTFRSAPRDWRDKAIIAVPAQSIRKIDYAYGDTTFSVELMDSVWMVGSSLANQSAVNNLITTLSSLTCDDFLASPPPQKIMATISLSGLQVSFAYDRSVKKYYATSSSSDRWHVLEGWRADQVLKRKKDLL